MHNQVNHFQTELKANLDIDVKPKLITNLVIHFQTELKPKLSKLY